MFSLKPDYEKAQARVNAFWNHEEVDRPLLFLRYPKPDAKPFQYKTYATLEERWLDVEHRAMEIGRAHV